VHTHAQYQADRYRSRQVRNAAWRHPGSRRKKKTSRMAEREPSSGLIANLSEQRMADQMSILDKFYNHYDSQQWHAVIEMEGQVRDACDATLTWIAIP